MKFLDSIKIPYGSVWTTIEIGVATADERKITIREVAEILGISEDAPSVRIRGGTPRSERDENGKVYVLVVEIPVGSSNAGGASDHPTAQAEASSDLIEELCDRVRYLERQLDAEREARVEDNRRKDQIIADFVQRIPQPETLMEQSPAPRRTGGTFEVEGRLRKALRKRASLAVEAAKRASYRKRKPQLRVLLAIVALALLAPITGSVLFATEHQNVAIPSYFSPGALWTEMEDALPEESMGIVNPSSGPGSTIDQSYAVQVKSSQAAGLTVLGYVHTDYGRRPSSVVRSEIDKYYLWYGVDGIFFDEGSTDCSYATSYYKDLYEYVNSQGGRVVLNPGTQTNECYMGVTDIVVNFEDTYTNYQGETYSQPEWISKYSPKRFWHLVHAVPTTADMQEAVRLSKERNAGFVYVTSDTLPNPWDTLPTFLSDEQKAVQKTT